MSTPDAAPPDTVPPSESAPPAGQRAGVLGWARHWFADNIFKRIIKNAALLLSGRATNGLLGLATLSLSARGLGLEEFGIFVLLQTYVQVIAALATFQSWQAVIRYGAICMETKNVHSFQSLVKFTSMLDVAGCLLAAAIGVLAAPFVGPSVDWNPQVITYAQIFSLQILVAVLATPIGLLRLFDRFDLLAGQAVITPLLRLVGVGICVYVGAELWAYLVAWFIAGIVGSVALMIIGWREASKRGWLDGMTWSLAGITAPHGGIWKFSIFSNLHASLQLVTQQASTFLCGWLAGPAAAGLFKIGRDVATGISKPAELLNQSIYPEFARLGSRGEWPKFKGLIFRGEAVAGSGALAMLALSIFGGPFFIDFFFGDAFVGAYVPLVLLVATAGLTLVAFPMEPALYAMGRPSIPLRIETVVVLVIYLPVIFVLTKSMGPTGAAIASVAAAFASFVALTAMTVKQLRRRLG